VHGLGTSSPWVGEAFVEIGRGCGEGGERYGAEDGVEEEKKDEFLNPPERSHRASGDKLLRGKIPGNPG
jgi:hypothetical protein